MFGKFKLPSKSETKGYFLDELQQLVLPADPLLDPANAMVEAPHDDRFQMAQGIDQILENVVDVSYPLQSSDLGSNYASHTTTLFAP